MAISAFRFASLALLLSTGSAHADCDTELARAARDGVLFASGRGEVVPESLPVVERVAAIMATSCSSRLVSVAGHTDADGGEETNLRLSLTRASAVAALLMGEGLAPQRVTAVGYGESRPVADNDTPQGRARNRRIEFLLTERGPAEAPGQGRDEPQ